MNSCRLEGQDEDICQCMMEETMRRYPRYENSEEISFEEAVEINELCKQ